MMPGLRVGLLASYVLLELRLIDVAVDPPWCLLQMVGTGGIEPPTSSVSGRRSPTELRAFDGRVDRAHSGSIRLTTPLERVNIVTRWGAVPPERPDVYNGPGPRRLLRR